MRLDERRELDPQSIFAALEEHEVEYVVVGGIAAITHGSQRLTRDCDLIVEPSAANRRRLIAALVSLKAEIHVPGTEKRIRLSPDADPSWIGSENRFFDTRAGGIGVWNRAEGMPSWQEARSTALEVDAFGHKFLVLAKDVLIRAKLASGREKDLADVAELSD